MEFKKMDETRQKRWEKIELFEHKKISAMERDLQLKQKIMSDQYLSWICIIDLLKQIINQQEQDQVTIENKIPKIRINDERG
jgi:hypothetical protein